MGVIQFPPAKNPPVAFEGMDIKIDRNEEEELWAAALTSVPRVLRFWNLDHVESEKKVRGILDRKPGLIDEIVADWAGNNDYFEMIIATMNTAIATLEVSRDHAIASYEGRNQCQPKLRRR